MIAEGQGRWLKIACAFPSGPTSLNRRGINGTDWIRIDRALYDSCLDTRDYRPKRKISLSPPLTSSSPNDPIPHSSFRIV
jgi:hypothetical protein